MVHLIYDGSMCQVEQCCRLDVSVASSTIVLVQVSITGEKIIKDGDQAQWCYSLMSAVKITEKKIYS